MRIVIHAGTHKTGTSAIQNHFFAHPHPGVTWAPWTDGNHCGLFILLFEEPAKLGDYHGFKSRGPQFIANLPAMREQWEAKLRTALDSAGERTFVISAEDISAPIFRGAVERMRDYLRRWTDNIDVIAYARSPRAFAVSAFQEKVKAGLKEFDAMKLWPHYRARLEPLDQLFGADRVTVRAYDRARLTEGDVVYDFAQFLGITLAGKPKGEVNASLNAAATALLFAQRKLGDGFVSGFPGVYAANQALIRRLQSFGGARFDFADSLWAPVLQRYCADLEWIEQRLGEPLADRPSREAVMIGSEDDLLKLAQDCFPLVEQALVESIAPREQGSLSDTVRAVDQLRRLSY